MMQRGANALAERLDIVFDQKGPHNILEMAGFLVGPHGLFIADVREHKPYARLDRELVEGDIHDRHRKATLTCSCGWVQSFGPDGAEHWLDHIVGAP